MIWKLFVIFLHHLLNKTFYKRRLPVYNCTLLDFGKEKRDVTCYCWNEGVGNKGANEVGSSLFKYLTEKADGKPITFMSDTCASQCRNMYISALMLYVVAFLDIPEINQKYFEPGHSQMEVDNIHDTIELAKKIYQLLIHLVITLLLELHQEEILTKYRRFF